MSINQSLLTNELKLHDYKGVKLSITFGDTDINDGYSYSKINYRVNDLKMDLSIDRPILNFITDSITINDEPIWTLKQQGPNTGMNSDMLDGLHAYDFKDRLGSHHYYHMFNNLGGKKFIKIATFTPRKVGTPRDFSVDGSKNYSGVFSKLELNDKIAEFNSNTIVDLSTLSNTSSFATTNMMTEGIYNSSLRANITILKNNNPTTVDVHVGLFNDPLETGSDGWNTMKKMFYVSLHDNNIPYISNSVNILDAKLTKTIEKLSSLSEDEFKDEINKVKDIQNEINNMPISRASITDTHTRPAIDKSGYAPPLSPSKNYVPLSPFTNISENIGYSNEIDIFRLYHVESKVENIDGLEVITNKFDLYMAIDEKAELHIQPFMSSSCLLYNFEEPISEARLPSRNYIKPKSIYDNRYASKIHFHKEYEDRIMHLINEIDGLWDMFDKYVLIEQSSSNARKVMMTDNEGKVFAADDNFERHQDLRRGGLKVLVTNDTKCISESSITTTELSYLEGLKSNIQEQIDYYHGEFLNTKFEIIEGKIEQMVKNEVFESYRTQTAGMIQDKVSSLEFTSYRTQTDRLIEDKVSSAEYNSYRTQTDKKIEDKVSSSTFSSYRTQTDSLISQKVSNAEFGTKFNQTANGFDFSIGNDSTNIKMTKAGLTVKNGGLQVSNSNGTVVIDGSSNMFKIAAVFEVSLDAGSTLDYSYRINHGFGYVPAYCAFQVGSVSSVGVSNTMLPALNVATISDSMLGYVGIIRANADTNDIIIRYDRANTNVASSIRIKVFIYKEALI